MKIRSKAIILSAPSGAGKTSILKHLLKNIRSIQFSISATSRIIRPNEVDGVDYYFLSPEEFINKIKNKEFIEWEEVYKDVFYGTLKSEIERIWREDKTVIFDVDVKGGVSLKTYFGEKALSIFIKVNSLEELKSRLLLRGTETEATLNARLNKAKIEMEFEKQFDKVIVNDKLEKACLEAESLILAFLKK